MRIEVIQTLEEFEALSEQWNRLRIPSPMQSHAWLSTWWSVYRAPHRQLQMAVVRDHNAVVAVAPLYIETGRFGQRWRLLGDGKTCSDHTSLLVDPHFSTLAVEELVDWFGQRNRFQSCPLHLESINADDCLLNTFTQQMLDTGGLVTDQQQAGSAFVNLPESWDEYLMSVSKNHRKRCRRWDKEFFQSNRASVEVATDPDHCLQAWTTLVELHNTRRTELGQTGAFEDPLFADFHRQAIPRLAAADALQLRILRIDSQPVAAEYLLVDDRAWFAYQSGMNHPGQQLGAGNLSIMAMLRDAIDSGVAKFDLLRGAEPYKFSWGAVHLPAITRTLRRPSASAHLATLGDSAWQAARQVKSKLVSRP